jgi:phenylacetate-CoA ligase
MVSTAATTLLNGSPVWLQNLAISAYGWQLRHLRYGGEFGRFRAELDRSDRYTASELADLQTRLLRTMLTHAVSTVPYYQQHCAFQPARFSSMNAQEMLAAFPILPKSGLRATPGQFIAQTATDTVGIQTSGSTGSPLQITTTRTAIQHNYAFFARFLGWHGVSPFDESATFAGRLFGASGPGRNTPWRRNAAMHDTLFSSYNLSEENLPSYIRELERRQPVFIDSYPSSVYRVASFLKSRGQPHRIRPRLIVTSSETLLDFQRHTIEEVFGCPVRDQYGSAEMAGFFAECEHGRYHVAPEYGFVEIIDADGAPVPTGETGELCLTGLINPAMPLIRYLIGDVGRLSDTHCACGRHAQVVESIEGRTDDVIITPSGRHVGRLDPAFKGVTGIHESQILQTARDQVVVRVVSRDPSQVNSAALIGNLQERIGTDVRISIEFVDSIDKEANGKFRSVKSLLPRDQTARR